MRNPVENITTLQKQLNELQLENQMLKNLLDRAGIPYAQAIKALKEPEQAAAYDPDQGARIIHPKQITMLWPTSFTPDSGAGRMYMRSEMKRRKPKRRVILPSATISGRRSAPKRTGRK